MPARVPVTAVLVAHDGSRWLPEALAALASQTVTPSRVVAVDTGSEDGSEALLRQALPHVLRLPRATGYAAAVAAALAAVPSDTRWIWLLHDDCAPERDALSALLRHAATSPSAAVLGPKVVDWDDPRVLVEIGTTTALSGVRDAGLAPGELDQRQHDAPRDVLAVGTAGALIRREVWEGLGGLDPQLPGFRDDLDLGWRVNAAGHRVVVVPSARVRHVRAASTGRRPHEGRRAASSDRQSALLVAWAHATGWRLPYAIALLLTTSLLRALCLLVGRRPREAWDELTAPAHVLRHPRRLVAARRARARTRSVPYAALRPLLSSPTARVRQRLDVLLDRGAARAVPGLDEPDLPRPTAWRRLRDRPGLLLCLALLMVAAVAGRGLIGRGALTGGRLLPLPDGAGAGWRAYADSADPALALLAAAATLLPGAADTAVSLLLLAMVPAAGAVAYVVAGRVVSSTLLRVWGAATWALLPVATGAVAAGRVDAAVVHIALPALLLGAYRLLTSDPWRTGWPRAWAFGLALTAVVATAPVVWPLALLLLATVSAARVAAATPTQRPAARRQAVATAIALTTPLLLLLPWSLAQLSPSSLLHGPGRVLPELSDPLLPAWQLLLLQPGGPGTAPLALTAPLLLAALAGLLRTRRARVAAAGWGLALAGAAAALVLARLDVGGVLVWPGIPLDLTAAGMLLAALVGAEGLQRTLARSSFGWRQVTTVAVVAAAALTPAAAAADWVRRGVDGPVHRSTEDPLPAFAAAELAATPGLRALLLSERPDGSVAYAVTGARGTSTTGEMDVAVADLLAPRGTDAAAVAARHGIGFVALAADAPSAAASALDAQPGLDRHPAAARPLWRVERAVTLVRDARPVLGAPALAAQGLALLVVGVLAAPGVRPRRGLERVPRR